MTSSRQDYAEGLKAGFREGVEAAVRYQPADSADVVRLPPDITLREAHVLVRRAIVLRAFKEAGYNRTTAARALRISYKSFLSHLDEAEGPRKLVGPGAPAALARARKRARAARAARTAKAKRKTTPSDG